MTGIFVEVVNRSITAGWLVLAVAVLRLVLKKGPRWVNLLLWGMVALRLLFPVSVESSFSLIPDASSLPGGIAGDAYRTEAAFGENGAEGAEASYEDVEAGGKEAQSGIQGDVGQGSGAQAKGIRGNGLSDSGIVLRTAFNYGKLHLLSIVWLSGGGLMLCYALFSYLRLRRQVSEAVLFRDNIFRSGRVDSPFVLGLIKPRIYIPFQMEERHLELVALHEQVHIRRGDHWWKPLGFGLLSVYWFHPLMWLAYVLLCRDIEMACDERVVRGLDRQRRADYSQALLDCSVRTRGIRACPLAFGGVGMKNRIRAVLSYRKPGFWTLLAALAVCAAAALCFLTNPVRRDTLVWAQALEAGEVAEAEVVIYNAPPDKQYKKLTKNDIAVIVSLINQSRGSFVAEHEEMEGGSTFLYLTLADGSSHEVGNMGNTYLVIDGDYFEADYSWLSSWDSIIQEGEGPLPEENPVRQLTLDEVLELSEKGEALVWADFRGFAYTETGSGLYIRRYEIDEEFDLIIGGHAMPDAGGAEVPLYITLRASAEPGWALGESVEIRTEDTEAFIRKHQNPQALEEVVIWEEADLDRDGETEIIRVRETVKGEAYVLEVLRKDGTLLWSEEAGTPLAGWNTLLLYQEGGEDYLIRYHPNLSQGFGSFTCEQFSLAGGAETPENAWEADFELASGEVTRMMRAFAEQANQFMKVGTVLLSTQDGRLAVGPWRAEELSWLYPVRFYPENWESVWADFAAGLPEDTAPLEFVLASGAGGWGTSLTLHPDGSFEGVYENGENEAAEEYPRGTRYICRFSGKFDEITKTGEYTCSMRLAELNVETEEDKVWIEDGIRYIGARAFGVEGGEEFILCLPGAPMAELDAVFVEWAPDYYLWRDGGIRNLSAYGLYNVEGGYGFFTNWH